MKILKILPGLLLAAVALPVVAPAQQYVISTVAGNAGDLASFGDTFPATSAGLYMPTRVAFDSKGNYYIVDYLSELIREVTAGTGIIGSIAGNGSYGFAGDNGPGLQAMLSDVHGIAVDSSGNVFLADTGNSRIRKVDTSGNITTFAGSGTLAYSGDGGAATNAALGRPGSLAIDSTGNLYVPDYAYSVVRKITASGTISTFAGTGAFGFSGDGGAATKATFAAPVAVAVDSAGNVYVSDSTNANIRKITSDGKIQTVATNVDAAGIIYFPDYLTNTVKKILPNGTMLAIAGTGVAGFSGDGLLATNAQLNLPYGVTLGPGGTIYVADSGNSVIRVLTPVSSPLTVVNAASSLGGAISPGEIVAIYGSGIGPASIAVNQPINNVFGPQVGGTTVSFDGIPAPLIYASATQVAAIVPYAEAVGVTSQVSVSYAGNTTTTTIPTAGSAPGIFTTNSSGSGQAAVVNQNGTLNSLANPAPVGGFISIYATGEGYTNPGGVDGGLDTVPLPAAILPVTVFINGQKAQVTYSGGSLGEVAGLLQVNVQIPQIPPAQLTNGPVSLPVVVQVNGVPSQTGATISVSN